MPPKADPYATATQRRIDALLLILTALIALIFFWDNITERVTRNRPDNPISSVQSK